MSTSTITIIDFTSDKALRAATKLYLTIQKEYFPNAQAVINIQTGLDFTEVSGTDSATVNSATVNAPHGHRCAKLFGRPDRAFAG